MPPPPQHNPAFHTFALFLTVATFPLIFIGGLVTSHGAGMAVPDWPNSYGYNMFLFPPSKWVGNIWYEHVHRLYASFIGLLSIVLCVWAWLGRHDRRVRWLATAVLGGVILQGVLGGLRVVLAKLDLAIVHGCVAQAFFCLSALVAIVSSRWWADAPDLAGSRERPAGNWVYRLAVVAVLVVFGQLVLGAVMRHNQAGLAIPDFPLAYGRVLPPTNYKEFDDALARRATSQGKSPPGPALDTLWRRMDASASDERVALLWRDGNLQLLTLTQVWLAYAHRLGAIAVSLTLLFLVYKVTRLNRGRPSLLGLGFGMVLLLLTQFTLGILTVLLRKPADVASAHVAVGALVLVTTFTLAARAVRLYRPRPLSESVAPRRGFEVGGVSVPDHLLPASY